MASLKKAVIGTVALVAILATAAFLFYLRGHQKLGTPGLRVVAHPGTNTVEILLPEHVLDYQSRPVEVTPMEIKTLPPDTSFGKRLYVGPDGFNAFLTVVLMGSDRTSIHKPQFCLTGQGWAITQSSSTNVSMQKPKPYSLPIRYLRTAIPVRNDRGETTTLSGLYLYWFVADQRLTEQHWERMWWMFKDLLATGVLPRWAYVSCFSTCLPGQEDATFRRMQDFLAAAVPEFQLVSGEGATGGSNRAQAQEIELVKQPLLP
jgi:hypothetical protein